MHGNAGSTRTVTPGPADISFLPAACGGGVWVESGDRHLHSRAPKRHLQAARTVVDVPEAVTPDAITAALDAAGVTEWYSVGVEDRLGAAVAVVGVTSLTEDVDRRVRQALAPTVVELHEGDRPRRY